MINIIRGSSEKYVVAEQLANFLEKRTDIDGNLYIGYPIIPMSDGAYDIDAMLITKQHGVIIFDMVIENRFSDRNEIQDDLYTKIQARLLSNKKLVEKRKLKVEINIVTFASSWRNVDNNDFDLVTNEEELNEFLDDINWLDNEYYERLLEDIQAITQIREKRKRTNVKKETSRGAKLIKLEESIANLDSTQSEAVIETVEGPQRIRGLAGSGKTIVLALKVAYLHANNPDWNIVVTFNTRSLKNQFYDLVTRFTYEHTKEEPDWDKIRIIHAWGSPRATGIYYELCKENGISYYDYSRAQRLSINGEDPFELACKIALKEVGHIEPKYDVVLVDEAQDFSSEFLQICYHLLKKPKRLIYAYDELQSLNKKQMKSPEEIFGTDDRGNPLVVLNNPPKQPKQDIILKVCYRNSRPILATAHALGFGIYRDKDKGLTQMFDQAWLWKDVGYEILSGKLEDGNYVKLGRTANTSPLFLEQHSDMDDLIQFKAFENESNQTKWLAEQIKINLEEDELQFQDIIVVHTDPYTTKSSVAPIRKELFEMGINSHLTGVTSSKDDFYQKDSITFTSIYRAKGNEAAMVYVIDAHKCYDGYELARKRNILFTAITRSKAWVRVTGYGSRMANLKEEFLEVKDHDFELEFIYPTEEQREKMHRVNRDMTEEEINSRKSKVGSFTDAIKALDGGEFYIEDIPPEILETLREKLNDDKS